MSDPIPNPAAERLELRKRVAEAMGWTNIWESGKTLHFMTGTRPDEPGTPPTSEVPHFLEDPTPVTEWLLMQGWEVHTREHPNKEPYLDPRHRVAVELWRWDKGEHIGFHWGETRGIAVCRAAVEVARWERENKQ